MKDRLPNSVIMAKYRLRYLFRESIKKLGQEAICPEMSLKRSRSYCGVWLTYRLEPEYDHYASQLNITHSLLRSKKNQTAEKKMRRTVAKEVCVWMRNCGVVIILKDIFRQLNCQIVKYSVKFILSIHRRENYKKFKETCVITMYGYYERFEFTWCPCWFHCSYWI